MVIWTVGLNHRTAPQDLRGRFAFGPGQIDTTLKDMRQSLHGRVARQPEAAILSTCNRTEIYCAGPQQDVEPTVHWLAQAGGVAPEVLKTHCYTLENGSAARHAFRVASGLDSMVIGEPQILGQLKDAVRAAGEAGALGTTLNQLFQRSFAVAKEVRSTTEIGSHSISMAAAAVRLALQLFGGMDKVRVVFVGSGKMIELAAAHFAGKRPAALVIASRNLGRAQELALRVGAEVMRLADLPGRLHEFDVVVSCTSSQLPLIGLGTVERAMKQRARNPLLMVDLAVPRDIEPEVGALDGVHLYAVDDLARIVQAGQRGRHAAVAHAEAIIDAGVQDFSRWMADRGAVPLIHRLDSQARQWRSVELQRARKRLATGEDIEQVLESLAKGLTQKMLHGALSELHRGDAQARQRASSAIELLFLHRDPEVLRHSVYGVDAAAPRGDRAGNAALDRPLRPTAHPDRAAHGRH